MNTNLQLANNHWLGLGDGVLAGLQDKQAKSLGKLFCWRAKLAADTCPSRGQASGNSLKAYIKWICKYNVTGRGRWQPGACLVPLIVISSFYFQPCIQFNQSAKVVTTATTTTTTSEAKKNKASCCHDCQHLASAPLLRHSLPQATEVGPDSNSSAAACDVREGNAMWVSCSCYSSASFRVNDAAAR